jgi:hypothetical protein
MRGKANACWVWDWYFLPMIIASNVPMRSISWTPGEPSV